jgi:hypothetical protein
MVTTKEDPAAATVVAEPEFVDAKGARQIFSLSRSYLHDLRCRGLIKSSCLRRPGKIRGRRLYCAKSIRAFLEAHVD